MKKIARKNLIFHIVCLALLTVSILCSVFVFGENVLYRTLDGFVDIGTSCAYYVGNMISLFSGENPVQATVILIPENAISLLPWTWDEFCARMQTFWNLLWTLENLAGFGAVCFDVLFWVSVWITFLAPLVVLLLVFVLIKGDDVNTEHNKDTKPLKAFKWLEKHIWHPVKKWVQGLWKFIKERRHYWGALLLLWVYNLNFGTIILEVIAYLIYFVAAFDVLHLYTQIAKLFMDLMPAIEFVPVIVWAVVGWIIFDLLRIKMAKEGRRAREEVNKTFVKALSLIVLIIGTTGKKKTTILADISLTKGVEFREQALSAIETNEMKFPFFPWINLAKSIEKAERRHAIYNWASCRRFIRLLRATEALKGEARAYRQDCLRYLRKHYGYNYKNLLFDYNAKEYGTKFDNSLYIEDLYDVLESYAQEYYIYRMPSSLITGNLPVRERIKWKDEGNFPQMDADFFDRKSKDIPKESQFSHIVENDWFRLGKLYTPHNPRAGAFEFGVVDFDEWAKDRGNQVTNKGMSVEDNFANPMNDEFNLDMKTRRQSAMVDNDVYVFFVGTEQRASSMNADLLELCDILDIGDSFKFNIGIPFYHWEQLLNVILQGWFSKWKKKEKLNHGNNSLLKYLILKLYGAWWRFYLRRLNEFGYFKGTLKRTLAGTEGKVLNAVYYLQFKKVYAQTFASDTFGAYYQTKADRSDVGLNDVATYKSVRQTIDEMSQQGSYYVEKLNATFGRGQRREVRGYNWVAEKKDQQAQTICDYQKQLADKERALNSQKDLVTELRGQVTELREAVKTAEKAVQSTATEAKPKETKAKPTPKPKN